MSDELERYASLLGEVRARVRNAQARAAWAANRELLLLYWDVGRIVATEKDARSWGAAVIPRLAEDLKSELPELSGFSARNIWRMVRFYEAYPTLGEFVPTALARSGAQPIVPPPVAQLGGSATRSAAGTAQTTTPASPDAELAALCLGLPWAHNYLLIEKVPAEEDRAWYMRQTAEQGWSRDTLALMIKSAAHTRQGAAVTNFAAQLPPAQSDLARQALKDPYVFDFLTLDAPFREREIELGLIAHLERFLLELGVGFAFVGRQYHLEIGDDDFYLDLLFYHLKLRAFVVVDLKIGPFKPDYAGKMNFYLNLVDDALRHEHDNPSIGLILCQDKKKVLAEYALRGMDKPIGVSEYELSRALPESLESVLPTIEEIEAELAPDAEDQSEEGTRGGEAGSLRDGDVSGVASDPDGDAP